MAQKNRPDYVNSDVNKYKKQIEDARKAGKPLDPSIFNAGLLYKPYSGTALSDLLKGDRRDVGSVSTPQPQVQPMQSNIRRDLPQMGNPNNVPRADIGGQQQTPPILKGAGQREKQVKSPPVKIEIPHEHVEPIISSLSKSLPIDQDEEVEPIQSEISRFSGNEFPVQELPMQESPMQPEIPNAPYAQAGPSSIDQLRELLLNPPTLEGNKPSKLRRFGAALTGGLTGAAFGPEEGVKQARNIVEKPYRESYQDWATRTGALGQQVGLESEQTKLGLEQQKVNQGELSSIGSYLRSIGAIDPKLQGDIEGARYGAREEKLEPGREKASQREMIKNTILEGIRATRETELEKLRQGGRSSVSDKEIAARERLARAQINSRANIAAKARELKKQMSVGKNQRIPPSQQALAALMAENEIAKTIADPEIFTGLFEEVIDKTTGAKSYRLKMDQAISETLEGKYKETKTQIDNMIKSILRQSFSPTGEEEDDRFSDEEDDDDIEGRIDFEEID